MKISKPKLLHQGDTIGIVALSSPVASKSPIRLERSIRNFEKLGFNILLGHYAKECYGHTAGTIDQRIDDLHFMYENRKVKAIVSMIGGNNSNQILNGIDFNLIQKNPKILMGYSDITAILLAVFIKTNQVTFMGPALLPQFGEFDGLHPYIKKSLEVILMSSLSIGKIPFSFECINEFLKWDEDDVRPRIINSHPGPRVVKKGSAKGKIIAGNLGTLLSLCGTGFFPDLKDAILLIEESENKTIEIIDRYLTQLRLMGVYKKINGLIVGRLPESTAVQNDRVIDDTLLLATRDYTFPIVVDFDIGHTGPIHIIPIGLSASLSAYDEIEFVIDDNAVVE